MSKAEFCIGYPKTKAGKSEWSRRYGMNAYYAGKHWATRQKDAETWHLITAAAMNRCKVRSTPFKNPVEVTFYWNDRLDIDNHAVMGKMIVDAMKGRLIPDDNRQHLRGVSHYFHDEDYIKVEVKECKE